MSYRFLSAFAVSALISSTVAEPFPLTEEFLSLLARQANPSCHRDCGQTIVASQSAALDCTDVSWLEQLNRCLACADTLPDGYAEGILAATDACDFDVEIGGSVPIPGGTPSPTTSGSGSTGTSTATESAAVPEVTNCHSHGSDPAVYCQDGDNVEWEIVSDLGDGDTPDSLTDCERGDSVDALQCAAADGTQVELSREGDASEAHSDDSDDSGGDSSSASTSASTSVSPPAETGTQDSAASALLPLASTSFLAMVVGLLM